MKQIIIIVAALFSLQVSAQTYKGTTASSMEEELNEAYCTGLFKSTHGTILDVASSPSISAHLNILDWLQGRVAGLQVYNTRNGISIPVIRGGVPALFVDEMQVSPSFLEMLNVNDIAMIKVIKTPFYGGFNGGNGAIAVYTFGEEEEEQGNR